MSVDDVQRRQEIVQSFKRRVNREILLLIPVCTAMYLTYESVFAPDFAIAGLRGTPLLLAAFGVVMACAAFHLANWRCPACGWIVTEGLNAPYCSRCGALFVEPEGPFGMDLVAGRQAQVERAVEIDLRNYRNRQAVIVATALGMIGLGLFVILVPAQHPSRVLSELLDEANASPSRPGALTGSQPL